MPQSSALLNLLALSRLGNLLTTGGDKASCAIRCINHQQMVSASGVDHCGGILELTSVCMLTVLAFDANTALGKSGTGLTLGGIAALVIALVANGTLDFVKNRLGGQDGDKVG